MGLAKMEKLVFEQKKNSLNKYTMSVIFLFVLQRTNLMYVKLWLIQKEVIRKMH